MHPPKAEIARSPLVKARIIKIKINFRINK
jgi:hypothetical protein